MQVIKILKVESPIHLWTLLKNKEEIFEKSYHLIQFLDCVEEYVNGYTTITFPPPNIG